MDANKARKLVKISYRVRPCCGLCVNAVLSPDGWGTCRKHTYSHEKHSESLRQLSITQYGLCDDYQMDEMKWEAVRPFNNLLQSLKG